MRGQLIPNNIVIDNSDTLFPSVRIILNMIFENCLVIMEQNKHQTLRILRHEHCHMQSIGTFRICFNRHKQRLQIEVGYER